MANFRRIVSALALSVVIGAGMVATGPTLHAAAPGSERSLSVRCALLGAALEAAKTTLGDTSDLAVYLQAQYTAICE